jgi:membrane-associated phospholipid phosphatase
MGSGLGLVLTRIILLGHWTSDVAVGLGVGALTERISQALTGYGRQIKMDFVAWIDEVALLIRQAQVAHRTARNGARGIIPESVIEPF